MKKLVLVLFFVSAILLTGCHHGYYGGRISYSYHDQVYVGGHSSHYGGYSHYQHGYGYSHGHHGRSPGPRHRGHNPRQSHSRH